VLFAISFIVFLYGIAKAYIFSNGEPAEVSKGHKLVMWGIIAFAIMISIWGLVNVVADTFGLSGGYAPDIPSSPLRTRTP
jgi:Ni,Fe-hydrogenase I cytochrome b subunit